MKIYVKKLTQMYIYLEGAFSLSIWFRITNKLFRFQSLVFFYVFIQKQLKKLSNVNVHALM